MNEELIELFKVNREIYESFRKRIVNLLEDLIMHADINIHQINSRTKAFDSISNKIIKKNKYTDLNEITDIVGIRIITYLESEVDNVEKLIRKEFKIDEKNSIDKRKLQTDQFGYRSLHIVGSLDESRLKLTEYEIYKGLKFEIQIRSVLQHAWAEIEHDLGYKGKSSIPDSYVRSFNRVAALLESADLEFDRLKKELTDYESKVSELIAVDPENVSINQASLDALVKSNQTFEKAREYIIKEFDVTFDALNDYSDIIDKFEFLNVLNIKELQTLITENSKDYLNFIKIFIEKLSTKSLAPNVPLFWFQHFLVAKTEDEDFIRKYLSYNNILLSGNVQDFIGTYQKIKKI
ncbi:ppGpp synthetase/RelA/SpoT-type nucleotidyltransferase [Flavobacterium sp. 90]|uniref:GTP pyrophosphokinase n=1 Tax=unclassified Flavobacterium TaxID=196869 RepID=UPI000EB342AD|nr:MULTISPECIES: (p)ppGpp synthetase [unclassified Flavobacterium]RKR05860.1 ppGpp synthetase/RelA/SpoT-type nucleotidyltransferase [Flavobacterium sp. 81]TCK57170.1 ppGpp synthetase/RelA/SpoT-type nucleotidyltransferase [Flavobacterium sp. 90]